MKKSFFILILIFISFNLTTLSQSQTVDTDEQKKNQIDAIEKQTSNIDLKKFIIQLKNIVKNNTIKLSQISYLSALDIIKNTEITNPAFTFKRASGYEYAFISGGLSIYNFQGSIMLGVTHKKNKLTKNSLTFFVAITLPSQWRIVQAIPGFNRIPIFKDIEFSNVLMILTNQDFEIDAKDLPANVISFYENVFGQGKFKSINSSEGINFYGGLSLDKVELLNKIKTLFAMDPSIFVHAVIVPKELKKSYIEAWLPEFKTPAFFPKAFKGVKPKLTISAEQFVELELPIDAVMPPKNDKLAFLCKIKITASSSEGASLQFYGKMEGKWQNPFNINGLALENLTLGGETKLSNPSLNLVLGGKIYIGSKEIQIAARIPASQNLSSLAFMGSITSISMQDIIGFANKLMGPGMQINANALPVSNIELRDVVINIAPNGGNSEVGIQDGIGIKGKMFINNKEFSEIDLWVNKSTGIKAKAWVKKLKLGPIELTGEGPDKKLGTGDDGAMIDIALTKKIQENHIFITGIAKILGLEKGILIEISKEGYRFEYVDKVFGLYKAKIESKMNFSISNPDFFIKAEFENEFFNFYKNYVHNLIKKEAEEFNQKLDALNKKMNQEINDAQNKLNSARNKLNDLKRKVEAPLRKIKDYEDKISSISNSIKKLTKERKDTNNPAKKAKLQTEITALYAARETAEKALFVAKKFLQGSEYVAFKAAEKALDAAEKTLDGVKKANELAIDGFKKINQIGMKVSGFIAKGGAITIEKASFEGNMKQLEQMKSPSITLHFKIMGQAYTATFQIDFKDVTETAKKFGLLLVNKVKEIIKDKIF